LAESNHDNWALGKIAKGYRYGEITSDPDKTHADLIPYAELTEDKKDYDRITAMETLKAIYALGYRIVRV
jgi:ryanodine receptor 2